ncbi:MAG TPA: UrcA family protein [Rhizomicrobium sp.]|nr:UrcA family protein [Rhizomicrobium sp.]
MSRSTLLFMGAAVVAGAAGLISFATPAASQAAVTYSYNGPPEEVIVTAPRPALRRFREQGGNMDMPPERVSLSTRVSYRDLDLLSPQGADQLRDRVVRAAYRVCRRLDEHYPFQRLSTSTPCEREAVENALIRADEAINAAREDYVYSFME